MRLRLLAAAIAALAFSRARVASAAPVGPAPAASPVAAIAAKQVALAGEDVEFRAADGWIIKGKYAPAQPGKKTVALLHGRGQRKEVWLRMTRALKRAGYGYLALDLRGHGQSVTAPDGSPKPWRQFKMAKDQNDYAQMALDVQAGVEFLVGRTVAEEDIVLLGDALGGSIAIKYAAVHPKVPMVVMLSPSLSYQEVTTVNAIRAYKNRPVLMVYGERDKNSAASTPILYSYARQIAGEENAAMLAVPNVHGNRLLNLARIRLIVAWLDNPVKSTVAPAPPSPSDPSALPPTEPETVSPEDSGAADGEPASENSEG